MKFGIFVLSVLMALVILALERAVGITWDYHTDSVTYATSSLAVTHEILTRGYSLALNNGYYLWAALLDMNINYLTAANIIFFSLANVLLYSTHAAYIADLNRGKIVSTAALLLIIANPYRLHLSTTLLKDSIIILLTIIVTLRPLRWAAAAAPILVIIRIASVLYLVTRLNRKYITWTIVIAVVLAPFFADRISTILMNFNSSDMQLRDFDQIPTFQDFGLAGVFIRALLWPVLAVTGTFAVISPAAAFFPVALGSIMTVGYSFLTARRIFVPREIFVSMAIFAALTTGYTAYIRYIYPLMVIMPLIILRDAAAEVRAGRRSSGQVPTNASGSTSTTIPTEGSDVDLSALVHR